VARVLGVLVACCILQRGGGEIASQLSGAQSVSLQQQLDMEIWELGLAGKHSLAAPMAHTMKMPVGGIDLGGDHDGGAGAFREGVSRWRPCLAPRCRRQATYGDSWEDSPRVCAQHRLPAQVDLNRKRCRHVEGCRNYAVFGWQGAAPAPPGVGGAAQLHSARAPRRSSPGAAIEPPPGAAAKGAGGSGGSGGSGEALLCMAHRLPGMSAVYAQRCAAPGCTVQASFAARGARRARHCAAHRAKLDSDVRPRGGGRPPCATAPPPPLVLSGHAASLTPY
jgi:hypothetical protein